MSIKIKKKKNFKRDRDNKVKISINLDMLDDILLYISSSNTMVTSTHLRKVKDLFNLMDVSEYANNHDMSMRIYFIQRWLTAKLDKNITDYSRIINYAILNSKYEEDMDDILEFLDEYIDTVSSEELLVIDEFITNNLNYSFIFAEKKKLEELSLQLEAKTYDDFSATIEEYKLTIRELDNKFRSIEAMTKDAITDISTMNLQSLRAAVEYTHAALNRPNNKVKTPCKYLNLALDGGHECGRTTIYFGLPGGWKSGMLLSSVLEAPKLNTFVTKDPTKTPTILYITQENDTKETLLRVWSHYFGNKYEPQNKTIEQLMEGLMNTPFGDGVVNFEIKYRKSRQINTQDIDTIIDNLEREGKEVVFLAHDYLKRIKSTEPADSQFMELGFIGDEFSTMAKDRDIPILLASQMNRDGIKIMEASVEKNKAVIKNIGASHIGESTRILENVDYAFILYKEPVEKNGKITHWVTYKKIKGRGMDTTDSKYDLFSHPMEIENTMKLVSDWNYEESKSVFSLNDGLENFDPKQARRARNEANESQDDESSHKGGRKRQRSSGSTKLDEVLN